MGLEKEIGHTTLTWKESRPQEPFGDRKTPCPLSLTCQGAYDFPFLSGSATPPDDGGRKTPRSQSASIRLPEKCAPASSQTPETNAAA
jgi:hypothetical protein